jgi:hypothetical protein
VGAAASYGASKYLPGAAGEGASSYRGFSLPDSPAEFGNIVASNTAGAIANAATRSALTGTSFGGNITAAVPDIVSGVVGDSLRAYRSLRARNQTISSIDHYYARGAGVQLAGPATAVSPPAPEGYQRSTRPSLRIVGGTDFGDGRNLRPPGIPGAAKRAGLVGLTAGVLDWLAGRDGSFSEELIFSDGDSTFNLITNPSESVGSLEIFSGDNLIGDTQVFVDNDGYAIPDFEDLSETIREILPGDRFRLVGDVEVEFFEPTSGRFGDPITFTDGQFDIDLKLHPDFDDANDLDDFIIAFHHTDTASAANIFADQILRPRTGERADNFVFFSLTPRSPDQANTDLFLGNRSPEQLDGLVVFAINEDILFRSEIDPSVGQASFDAFRHDGAIRQRHGAVFLYGGPNPIE